MSHTKLITITPEMVRTFSEAVHDFNPIHFDEEYASTTRFKRPIVHGALLGGLVSGMLVECFGEGTIYVSTHLQFLNPVYVGDMVNIELQFINKTKYSNVEVTVEDVDELYIAVKGKLEIIPGVKNV